jgi:TRAP-type C4-dicarboxylate transport system permease small subunit
MPCQTAPRGSRANALIVFRRGDNTDEDPMQHEPLRAVGRWLRRRANDVAVALMAIMFLSFLLQIAFRYLLNNPLGWTEEVTVLCWTWVVLWCAAFVLSDAEEVRFDIVYSVVPPTMRRGFVAASSIVLIVLLLVSLPASWNYVTFMKREHTAYLRLRLDFMYSIYVIFVLACVVRHAFVAWGAIAGRLPAAADPVQPEV